MSDFVEQVQGVGAAGDGNRIWAFRYAARSIMAPVGSVLFICNLFRFYPQVLDGLFRVFWFDLIVILAIVAALFVSGLRGERLWHVGSLFIGVALVLVLMVLAINAREISDLAYLARLVYAVAFVIAVIGPWARFSKTYYKDLGTFVLWSIPLMAGIFAVQLLPVPVLTDIVHFLYGTDKLRDIYSFAPRVFGSFYNANWAGVYLMVGWVVVLWRWQHKLSSILMAGLLGWLLVFMTVVTGSRTALLGIVVALTWLLLMDFATRVTLGRLISMIVILCSLFSVGIALYHFEVISGSSRFKEVLTNGLMDVESVEVRIETWIMGWEHFLASPLLGPGVSGVPHNSLITWLQAFGILGGVVLCCLIVALIYSWCRMGLTKEVQLSSAIFVGFFVMSQTAEFFFTTQLLLLVTPFIFGVFFLSRGPRETGEKDNG